MINTSDFMMRGPMLAAFLSVFLSAVFEVTAREISVPEPPFSVEQLRKWHRRMEPWPWLGAPEHKVYLRDEKNYQLLLAISGHARGATFVLFAKIDNKWVQMSDDIEQAHHPIQILKTGKDGWHDFQSFVPAWGSGGAEVWVSKYGWNGTKYVLKKQEDGHWCDFEPFKKDNDLCDTR